MEKNKKCPTCRLNKIKEVVGLEDFLYLKIEGKPAKNGKLNNKLNYGQ